MVTLHGRGRGLLAQRNIDKGEVLLVEKPFVAVPVPGTSGGAQEDVDDTKIGPWVQLLDDEFAAQRVQLPRLGLRIVSMLQADLGHW